MAKDERPARSRDIDLGYFTPDSKHFASYLNAVAAGGNFAILNRLVIFEQIADAFRKVFKEDSRARLRDQPQPRAGRGAPEFGEVWVHRKGATRAFPGRAPRARGHALGDTGHPVLIPGSNRDYSYILMPEAGAVKSGFSVNHGAGRRMSRGEAHAAARSAEGRRAVPPRRHPREPRRRVPLDESEHCYKSARGGRRRRRRGGPRARRAHALAARLDQGQREERVARERTARRNKDRSRDRDRDTSRRTKGRY